MTDSKFDDAEFYSADRDAETLSHEDPDQAVWEVLDSAHRMFRFDGGDARLASWLHAVDYHDPLIVYAFDRDTVDLGNYAGLLVELLRDTLEEDEELLLSGPDGDFKWDFLNTEILEKDMREVLEKQNPGVRPWTCSEVAKKEYTRAELLAILVANKDLTAEEARAALESFS